MAHSLGDLSAPLPTSLAGVEVELLRTDEALIDSIQDELVCVVCGSIFIDPRVLQCQHCFCLRCLYSTVARERDTQINVPCAYRCATVTRTPGDIRSLAKNHFITNTCLLLRQHLVRRARLLERKLTLLSASQPPRSGSTSAEAEPAGSAAASADASGPPAASDAALRLLSKREQDAVKEMHECEWCSCTSPSCEVCPFCWSRVCAECRGQFSDHQFLCVELRQPGRRPPEGWMPGVRGNGTAPDAALTGAPVFGSGSLASALDDVGGVGATGERGPEGDELFSTHADGGEGCAFPYLIAPFFVPVLVKECLVRHHQAAHLHVSEIEVQAITPVRLAIPEVTVECQNATTGFEFEHLVYPPFTADSGAAEVNLTLPHWCEGTNKPNAALLFLANCSRLGETVLQDLRKLSGVMSEVVLELSSAARGASVRRNKGFHMYAVHAWTLVRSQCIIARDALLPHLERARLLENIMGDLVTYRFQQAIHQTSPPQKHVVRDRCAAFMRTEMQLCRQLDQVMEGIDAACRGIQTLLARMTDVMQELAQPRVHRGEEHKLSRQSRLRFSASMFRSGDDGASATASPQQPRVPAAGDAVRPSRGGSSRGRWTARSGSAAADGGGRGAAGCTAAPDPILSDSTKEADSSFRGQVAEHAQMTRSLTESMLSILRCFTQARVWEWSLCNTCVRESGLGEDDRRTLLAAEEALQLITDQLMGTVWTHARMMYVLEVEQDAAGPAFALDILMDAETLELLRAALDCPTYDHSEVFESLKSLSQLRAQFVSTSATNNAVLMRNPDTQQELLNMMSSVLRTTMVHQTAALRVVSDFGTALDQRFAAYLRTRQMNPEVGERPPPSEDALLAVEVLKLLQRQSNDKLADYTAVVNYLKSGSEDWESQRSTRGGWSTPSQRELHLSTAPAEARWGSPFVTDFSLRDTALTACLVCGETLVRAANGQSLQRGWADELQSAVATRAAAAAAATAGELRDTPSNALETPTRTDAETDSNEASADAVRSHSTPPLLPVSPRLTAGHGSSLSAASQRTMAASAPASTSAHSRGTDAAGPSGGSVGSADDAGEEGEPAAAAAEAATTHNELLFDADADLTLVTRGIVTPSRADSDGTRKAEARFKSVFQLHATTALVRRRRVHELPFYRGTCVYKGVSTPFWLDAQTSAVFMDPQPLSTAGRRQYALGVLSSPLFFIALNSALSIFLQRRYQLEVVFK